MATTGFQLAETYISVQGSYPDGSFQVADCYLTIQGENMATSTSGQLDSILDYLVAQVQASVGHARVFSRARLVRKEVTLRALMVGPSGLDFYEVRRRRSPEQTASNQTARRRHTIEIVGRKAANDANNTEGALQVEVEGIADQLRPLVDLGGLCETFELADTAFEDVTFGGVACNQATVAVIVQEHISW